MKLANKQRVMEELKAVGVTSFGMNKFAIQHLPKIIHEHEHIKGIVYGRYKDDKSGLAFNAGLLVATDKRIIFLDHKPGYTKEDEITYDVVSGINKTTAIFSAVTLHTRLGDYTIRFANAKCAAIFVDYVEERQIKGTPKPR